MAVKGNIPDIGKALVMKLSNDLEKEIKDRKSADEEIMQTVNGLLHLITVEEISLPSTAWQEDGDRVRCDVSVEAATEKHYPVVSFADADMDAAVEAELSPAPETVKGAIRFWAKKRPSKDIAATAALLLAQE